MKISRSTYGPSRTPASSASIPFKMEENPRPIQNIIAAIGFAASISICFDYGLNDLEVTKSLIGLDNNPVQKIASQ